MSLMDETERDKELMQIMVNAPRYHLGVALYSPYRKVGLGLEKVVNLWLWGTMDGWNQQDRLRNNNLAILIGYILQRNWKAKLRVITRVNNEEQKALAQEKLKALGVLTRLPKGTEFVAISVSDELAGWEEVPGADLQVISLPVQQMIPQNLRDLTDHLRTSCLFLVDGGNENAIA
jgi:hypothetical protein